MGSFRGHVLPGSMFVMVGVWHLLNSIVNYVAHPKGFRGRVWHPVRGVKGRFKYTELYLIAAGSFIDMCIEFFYSTHMTFIVGGELNPKHMNDFEHAAMLLMFFLFYLTCILNESTGYRTKPRASTLPFDCLSFDSLSFDCLTFDYVLRNVFYALWVSLEFYLRVFYAVLTVGCSLLVTSCDSRNRIGVGCRKCERNCLL